MFSKVSKRWGALRQVHVPRNIVREDKLALRPNALAVLLVLVQIAKIRSRNRGDPLASAKVSQKSLSERTGFSKNIITKAIHTLEAELYVKCIGDQRNGRAEFGVNEYLVCHPSTGEPLTTTKSTSFYYGNGIGYFTVPKDVVFRTEERWSLANMSGSEISVYICLLWLADKSRRNEVEFQSIRTRKLSGLSRSTFKQSVLGLQTRGLIWFSSSDVAVLCDPHTGAPVHQATVEAEADPANYFALDTQGRNRRVNLNQGDEQHAAELVRSCLETGAAMVPQSNGDFTILCPFHPDRNPSCSFSPTKRCFQCFGCGQRGTLVSLVTKLRSGSTGDAIRFMAERSGEQAYFREPDSSAEAIYDYEDEKGKLIKRVLRFRDKQFRQRRLGPKGGWIDNIEGVKPSLYNRFRLQYCRTVFLVEGEKDADRVTSLDLRDCYGAEIVGTTSGGSNSWSDELADILREKRVILMPDNDEAGERYAAQAGQSLQSRAIEFRTVWFGDTGAKDVSDFLDQGHPVSNLIERLGPDWIWSPPVVAPASA